MVRGSYAIIKGCIIQWGVRGLHRKTPTINFLVNVANASKVFFSAEFTPPEVFNKESSWIPQKDAKIHSQLESVKKTLDVIAGMSGWFPDYWSLKVRLNLSSSDNLYILVLRCPSIRKWHC